MARERSYVIQIVFEGKDKDVSRSMRRMGREAQGASKGFAQLGKVLGRVLLGSVLDAVAAFEAFGPALGKVIVVAGAATAAVRKLAKGLGALARITLRGASFALRTLAVVLRTAFAAALRAVLSPLASLWTWLRRVYTIAAGILLADVFRKIAQGFMDFIRTGWEMVQVMERLEISFRFLAAAEVMKTGQVKQFAQALVLVRERAKNLAYWLQNLAAISPFTVEGIRNTMITFMAYGFGIEQAKKLTEAMVNYASAVGLSSDAMTKLALAIGQIRASGRLMGEEIRQLKNVIPIMEILAEHLGMTVKEVQELYRRGKIDAQTAIEAIVSYIEGNFGTALDAMRDTWWGIFQVTKNLIGLSFQDVLREWFKPLKPLIAGFRDLLQALRDMGAFTVIGRVLREIFFSSLENLDPEVLKERMVRFAKEGLGRFLYALRTMVKNVREGFQGLLDNMAPGVKKFLAAFGVDLDAILGKAPSVTEALQNIGEAAREWLPKLGEWLGNALAFAAEYVPDILEFFRELPGRVQDLVARVQEFYDNAVRTWEDVKERVKGFLDTVNKVVSFFRDVLAPVIEASMKSLGPSFEDLKSTTGPLVEALKVIGFVLLNVLVAAIGMVTATIGGLILAFKAARAVFGGAIAYMVQALSNFVSITLNVIEAVKALLQGNWAEAWGFAKQAVFNAIAFVKNSFMALGSLIFGVIATIISYIVGFVSTLVSYFQELYERLVGGSIIPDMVNAILNWFLTLKDKGVELVRETMAKWLEEIESRYEDMVNAGKNLIMGVLDGLKQKAQALLNYISGLASQVVDLWNEVWGIKSPSRVFHQIATYAIKGLVTGFENGAQRFQKVIQDMANVAMSVTGSTLAPTVVGSGGGTFIVNITVNGAGNPSLVADEVVRHIEQRIVRRMRLQGGL